MIDYNTQPNFLILQNNSKLTSPSWQNYFNLVGQQIYIPSFVQVDAYIYFLTYFKVSFSYIYILKWVKYMKNLLEFEISYVWSFARGFHQYGVSNTYIYICRFQNYHWETINHICSSFFDILNLSGICVLASINSSLICHNSYSNLGHVCVCMGV